MNNNAKALSGLSYLSIFFFPFLLPIIVYFTSKDSETRRHAKRAFISHVLTIVLSALLVVLLFYTFVKVPQNGLNPPSIIILFSIFLLFIAAFAFIFIWSIVQTLKVVR